jgi:ABC-type transport system substrate-binding protein
LNWLFAPKAIQTLFEERKMFNKKLFITGMLLVAAILLAACGGGTGTGESGTQAPEATPSSGGDSGSAPTAAPGVDLNLDPANAASDDARTAASYLYETLVREKDGGIVGALAASFTVSEDGLDYIFDLRQNAVFHDGSSLNADVVVLNFNRWFDPADANRGGGEYAVWLANFNGFKGETTDEGKPKSQVDGIEKQDEFTVIIHLNTPDPDLLTKLTDIAFAIVSPDAFDGGDGGTGPYYAAANEGGTLTLEPFAGYWDADSIPSEGMEVPAP